MSIANMRAKLDQKIFSTTEGFAEPITFRAPDGTLTDINCHVRTRVRPQFDDEEGSLKEMEELTITIPRSEIPDPENYQCQRSGARGTDHNRWFRFNNEIESDKTTRYRAIFTRRMYRIASANR